MDTARRKVTIVTGASRGIGAATALHLARNGHDVAVNFRSDEDAARLVVRAAEEEGARAVAVRADVTSENGVERLFAVAQQELGPVTGLVNNAGATLHLGDLADTPVEVVRAVLEVNLLGVLLCARRAAQVMSTRRDGSGGAIVNVSSAAATLGSAHEYVHSEDPQRGRRSRSGRPGRGAHPARASGRTPRGRRRHRMAAVLRRLLRHRGHPARGWWSVRHGY